MYWLSVKCKIYVKIAQLPGAAREVLKKSNLKKNKLKFEKIDLKKKSNFLAYVTPKVFMGSLKKCQQIRSSNLTSL